MNARDATLRTWSYVRLTKTTPSMLCYEHDLVHDVAAYDQDLRFDASTIAVFSSSKVVR